MQRVVLADFDDRRWTPTIVEHRQVRTLAATRLEPRIADIP
jgi:hypothetical protein